MGGRDILPRRWAQASCLESTALLCAPQASVRAALPTRRSQKAMSSTCLRACLLNYTVRENGNDAEFISARPQHIWPRNLLINHCF